MKIVKSPFFYCGLFGIAFLTACLFVLAVDGEPALSFQQNTFAETNYLFTSQAGVSLTNDLNIYSGSVLKPTAPPFLAVTLFSTNP